MLTPLITGESRTCFGVYVCVGQTQCKYTRLTLVEPSRIQDWRRSSYGLRQFETVILTRFRDKRCTLIFASWESATKDDFSWITNAQIATKMVLLARTTPLEEVKKPSEGLSLFCIDFDKTAPGLDLRKIKKMGGRAVDANEVFFDNYRIPADTLIGKEGQGFKIVRAFLNSSNSR